MRARGGRGAWVAIALLSACGARDARPSLAAPAPPAAASRSDVMPSTPPAAPPAAPPAVQAPRDGESRAEAAERVLFLATHLRTDGLRQACPTTLADAARVHCLVELRYADDAASKALAITLLEETGSLAGLLPEETTEDADGRKVRLLPARPIGDYRAHLEWILAAFRDYKAFLEGLSRHGPVSFMDRPIDFRFFYSERGHMPSAFAATRNIGYNLFGAVNVSGDAVRETLFHELFHLNDDWRGGWSKGALGAIYDRIVGRCGGRKACLSDYAPTDTLLSGTYYAFAPRSGVREYAAEVALRYYREHRLVLRGEPLPAPAFKCGPPENGEAMRLLAAEVFGGVDLVPPCKGEAGQGAAPSP